MLPKIIAISLFQVLSILSLFSQSDGYVQIDGTAEYMMEPLAQATIKLYKDNKLVETFITENWGRFKFKLDFNHIYLIEVSKESYVSKSIVFDTQVPNGVSGKFVSGFAIGLLDPCEGVDYRLLEKPIDKIVYDEKKNTFRSSKDYVYEVQGPMEMLVWKIQECLKDKYDQIIDEADKLFNEGKYREARNKYILATQADPYDRYPQKKIDEINDLLAEKDAINNAYADAIRMADGYFQDDNLKNAIKFYERALDAKPTDTYAKERLDFINETMYAEENKAKTEKENERKYANLVFQAEGAYNSKNYDLAKELFTEASAIKPQEPTPKERIAEIDNIIASENASKAAANQEEQQFNTAVSKAENLMANGQLAEAKAAFEEARTINPSDRGVLKRIEDVNELIQKKQSEDALARQEAQQQAKEQKLTNAITSADQLLANGNLSEAKVKYQEAAALDPDSKYVTSKIAEIDRKIDADKKAQLEQQTKNASYKRAVDMADQLIAQNKLSEAKEQLNKALIIKPGDANATAKLTSVDTKIKSQELAQNEKVQREQQYKEKVTQGDSYFAKEQYDEAMSSYKAANEIIPGGAHVQKQMVLINGVYTKRSAEKAKQEELDMRYAETIKFADQLLAEKKYNQSIDEYRRAKVYKPNEVYPDQKIAEAEGLLADLRSEEARLAKIRQQYRSTIASADKLYAERNYKEARLAYREAKQILPSETYPDSKINEIDGILQQQQLAATQEKQQQEKYTRLIAEADGLYTQKSYAEAKAKYQSASAIMDNETYPKQQIAIIDKTMSALNLERQEAAALKAKYDEAIASADQYFTTNNFAPAKSEYQKALRFLPDEVYPKQRIRQIDEKLALIAKSNQVTTPPKPKATSSGKPIEKLSFKNPSEKQKYIDDLKKTYGQGVSKEVYKEKFKTTERYIVVRNNDVNEFRKINYNWGTEYFHFDIQTTAIYFNQQTKRQGGEPYSEVEM